MNYIFSFIVAVTARLVGDFVSKWLNSHNADKQPTKKNPERCHSRGFSLVGENHIHIFLCGYNYYTTLICNCQVLFAISEL